MGFPREAFRQVIADVAGAAGGVTWRSAPLGYQAGARVILTIPSSLEIGWDDTKESFDPIALARTVANVKRRDVRVNVRVDSFDPNVQPLDIAENIRTRLYRESSTEALEAIGVGYLGSESLVTLPWIVDGRDCDSAVMVLRLNTVELDVDTTNEGGIIETCDVTLATTS